MHSVLLLTWNCLFITSWCMNLNVFLQRDSCKTMSYSLPSNMTLRSLRESIWNEMEKLNENKVNYWRVRVHSPFDNTEIHNSYDHRTLQDLSREFRIISGEDRINLKIRFGLPSLRVVFRPLIQDDITMDIFKESQLIIDENAFKEYKCYGAQQRGINIGAFIRSEIRRKYDLDSYPLAWKLLFVREKSAFDGKPENQWPIAAKDEVQLISIEEAHETHPIMHNPMYLDDNKALTLEIDNDKMKRTYGNSIFVVIPRNFTLRKMKSNPAHQHQHLGARPLF